ncbi:MULTISPECIES: superinfection immunity protein [Streptomyces]|uniref:Superinfection immunity protein n=1 Tax=Streptomyces solicathayae TaxID=3081768 RepID=A0ABZ0M4U4_9ACTN|nr:superinfection immunity protein [Streptomyces sp. HUAS YS2]WOX26772.1 superinfection immunity protein [Streptomyces sp. HUAS YS2]
MDSFLPVALVGLVLYFLPAFIGFARNAPNRGSVLVVNIFLGWTLIGWVVALAMSVSGRRH